jgi:hypothetical protein
VSSAVIDTVKIWISWVVICDSRRSSSSWCETYSCTWFAVLIELRTFDIVDVSWVLRMRFPCYS